MKTISKFFISLIVLVFLLSCEDILEEDITNDTVEMIYPLSSQSVYSNIVNFQWKSLKGADTYRVQVYSSGLGMLIDSLVSHTYFSIPLSQGQYQWRVRAENSAYQSNYSFNTVFSVFETDNLTNQQVILSYPVSNFYTNNTSLPLNWQLLNAAQTYNFELINVTNGEVVVNQQTGLTNGIVTLNSSILSSNGQYRWKVKGVNNTSQTIFSVRDFYLDTNSPNTPSNITPSNNYSVNVNQQINFNWTMPSDYGIIQSPISYTIEFSDNINFANIIQSSDVSSTNFQQAFSVAGIYYWRVKPKDLAGNIGPLSYPFKLIVN